MANEKSSEFYVWRRSDGYVAATANHMPQDYSTKEGGPVSFEQLGQFTDWSDASICIETARSGDKPVAL